MNLLNKTGLTYFWGKLKAFFVKGNARVYYGTCDTAAATAAKVVTCPAFTSSDLAEGTVLLVKFAYANTASVDDLTLNINNTGAIRIRRVYNGITDTVASDSIRGISHLFIFSEPSVAQTWYYIGDDRNALYTAMTQTAVDNGTSTTGRLITPKMLRDNFYTESEVDALIPSVPVTDVTVGGTSVVSNGTAVIPSIPTVPTDIVKYSSQSLSDSEKLQARTNIGIPTIVHLTDESDMPATPDANTIYMIDEAAS